MIGEATPNLVIVLGSPIGARPKSISGSGKHQIYMLSLDAHHPDDEPLTMVLRALSTKAAATN